MLSKYIRCLNKIKNIYFSFSIFTSDANFSNRYRNNSISVCPLILRLYFYAYWNCFSSCTILLSCDAWLIRFCRELEAGGIIIYLNFAGEFPLGCGIWVVCLRAGVWEVRAGVWEVIIFGGCGCWTWEIVRVSLTSGTLDIFAIYFFSASARFFASIRSLRFFLKQNDSIFLISSFVISLIVPFIKFVTI